MSEPKPFASLSSGLLARKGAAKPAMRPQSFRFNSENTGFAVANESLDDLGWNDMGDDTPVSAPAQLQPVALHNAPIATLVIPPRVVAQQEELAQRFQSPSPVPVVVEPVIAHPAVAPIARAAPGSKPKAAFTLRLDSERHLRLRLICAVNHRSAQQIVTQALDEYLARQPQNSHLATLG
ncbi:MAG: hypothetical protein AABY88_05050 [Pseudomonadota bacterium]